MCRIDLPTLITAHDELLSENLELRKQNEALQTQAHRMTFPNPKKMCGERSQRSFQLFQNNKIICHLLENCSKFSCRNKQTHQKIITSFFKQDLPKCALHGPANRVSIHQCLRGFHWHPDWEVLLVNFTSPGGE